MEADTVEYNIVENIRQIDEAIAAGNDAIRSLNQALNSLGSARNFGIWDMFGGGFISGMLKHSKINEANKELENTKHLLGRFKKEISDVHIETDIQIDIGEFAKFADYFFDGLIADWYVQSKINENRKKVENVKSQVVTTLNKLHELKTFERGRA